MTLKSKISHLKFLPILLLLSLVWPVTAADSVEPQSVTITNYRGEATITISSAGAIYQGGTLRFTNSVLYATTTNTPVIQGLSGITVEVAAGNTSTSIVYNATVMSTNAGTWACDIVVPALSEFLVQVRITDAATNMFIYPSKQFQAVQSLF